MKNIGTYISEINKFETLALRDTVIHRLHPATKLFSTLAFIIVVVSFKRYDFTLLSPFFFYPVVITAIAEIPYKTLLPKLLIALPFCLFAGISNVMFDQNTALIFFNIPVSYGVISLLTIIFKMILSVSAALLLTATTPLTELSMQLRRLHVPYVFVTIFEMTYRYIGVLLEETHSMTTAYLLRSKGRKALKMQHMGSFLGQILLRGFDRAERVYSAMLCRGYGGNETVRKKTSFKLKDSIYFLTICILVLFFRFVRIF